MISPGLAGGVKWCLLTSWIFSLMCSNTVGQSSSTSRVEMKIDPATGYLEISNGLLGIVIPWKQAEQQKIFNLAPIQSVIYADGKRSDNTLNLISAPTAPISFHASIVKSSTAEISVLLDYRFNKPKFVYSQQLVYEGGDAGPGYYRFKLTLARGQKSVTLLEESDFDIFYAFKISNGLKPDKARYRGWNAPSTEYGYSPDGSVYNNANLLTGGVDATVDLTYNRTFYYPQLSLWDQAGAEQSTGRYWMVFNSHLPRSNLFGFYQGKPKLLIGARLSGPQLITRQQDDINKEPACAEIGVTISRRTADNMWFPHKRYEWNIFISNTDDVRDPTQDQPIMKELNMRSSLGSTIRQKSEKKILLNPSFYQCAIFMPAAEVQEMIRRTKADYNYYTHLIQMDGSYRSIWDAWRFKDSARAIIDRLVTTREDLIKNYETGDGTFQRETRYWYGVRNFKIMTMTVAGLFADKSILMTAKEKTSLEQLVGLLARIVWDDNNVPVIDSAGVNMGPANMVFQYQNSGRYFFALLMSKDPEFAARTVAIKKRLTEEIEKGIFANGSSFGSPHYTQTGIDPIWFTLLQIKQAGLGNMFSHPLVKKYAVFLTSLLTPPSSRFNLNRKLISFGDGSEESAGSFGLLATGLKDIDPALSRTLLSLYYNGPPTYIFAGPAPLAISSTYQPPATQLTLTDCSYNGYATHFRLGANHRLESALWVLNGETFYDHRGDDRGEVALYALGAPLSLSRSSFYMPLAAGAHIRSMVVPLIKFPEWAGADQPIDDAGRGGAWSSSRQIEFASFNNAAYTHIEMTNSDSASWTRKILEIHLNDSVPIYVFYDSVSTPAVWSMMMMSDGPMLTPAGPVIPAKKMHNNNDLKQLPSGTPALPLGSGWNQFKFTGQAWRKHPYGGIDWNLYTSTSGTSQFSLAHWGTTWQNDNEVIDYKKSNLTDYKEEQQILRLKITAPVTNVLCPYLKGEDLTKRIFISETNELTYRLGHTELFLYPGAYQLIKADTTWYGWFGRNNRAAMKDKIAATGGSLELKRFGRQIYCYIQGLSGTRTIYFPFKVTAPVYQQGVVFKPTGSGTNVTMEYKSSGLDQAPGKKQYQVFHFVQS